MSRAQCPARLGGPLTRTAPVISAMAAAMVDAGTMRPAARLAPGVAIELLAVKHCKSFS
jgi:hypothetical protein